jgi:hypothetical protein
MGGKPIVASTRKISASYSLEGQRDLNPRIGEEFDRIFMGLIRSMVSRCDFRMDFYGEFSDPP